MGVLLGDNLLPMCGTSGGTFLPTAVPNLWAWWDIATLATLFQDSAGTTPVTTTADPIGYVADRSGNGRYVRQTGATSTRPTYTTGVQNGLPVVVCDGGDYLDSVATIDSFPMTILTVARTSATVGTSRGLVSNYSSVTFGSRIYFNGSNSVIAGIASPSALRTSTATFGANTPFIVGARFNTTESAIITNGTIALGSHSATVVTGNNVSLGRSNINNTTALFSGSFCEAFVYNRALTDTEIGLLTTYLNSKWSVY